MAEDPAMERIGIPGSNQVVREGEMHMDGIRTDQGRALVIPMTRNVGEDKNHELREAVYNADLERVETLLRQGANVNQVFLGSPLICLAAQSAVLNPDKDQSLSIVKLLIEHGADVELKDDFGWTAFDWGICCVLEGARELREILSWGAARNPKES